MTRTERWAGGLLAAIIIGALVVPAVARQDPLAIDDVLSARLVGPFSTDHAGRFHLLGTDRFGRDLFVRMMLAGRL
jgi:ABC-type dipeptide/oligopeptide/nickel transport system permease subunit